MICNIGGHKINAFIYCCGVCVYVLVAQYVQLFATPWTVTCQPPLSMGWILQAVTLEWIAVSFCRGSSQARD